MSKVEIRSQERANVVIAGEVASPFSAVAVAAAASATQAWDSFRGIYYGALAGPPAADPLGAAPGVGDIYFDTTLSALQIWDGTNWQNYSAVQASPYMLSLLDDPDAATARATLGITGFDGGTVSGNFTVENAAPVVALSDTSDGKRSRLVQNADTLFVASDSGVTFTDYAGSGDVPARPTVRLDGLPRNILTDHDYATYSDVGPVRLAGSSDANAGTNNTRPVTPYRVLQMRDAHFGWQEIETRTIVGGEVALDFTNLDAYRDIRIIPMDVVFSAAHSLLGLVSTDNGATWVTAGYAGGVWDDYSGYAPTSYMRFRDGTHTLVPTGCLDFLRINDTGPTFVTGLMEQSKVGMRAPAGIHNALRLYLTADTFVSGSFLIMGRK